MYWTWKKSLKLKQLPIYGWCRLMLFFYIYSLPWMLPFYTHSWCLFAIMCHLLCLFTSGGVGCRMRVWDPLLLCSPSWGEEGVRCGGQHHGSACWGKDSPSVGHKALLVTCLKYRVHCCFYIRVIKGAIRQRNVAMAYKVNYYLKQL